VLSSEQAWLRETAERSLLQLDTMDLIDSVEAAVRRAPPPPGGSYSWLDLARRGVLPGIPVDPEGTPLEIDAVTGAITLSSRSPLHPLPVYQGRSPR
jgi:hypothetical protein